MDRNTVYERLEDASAAFAEARYIERFSLEDFAALIELHAMALRKQAKGGVGDQSLLELKKVLTLAMTAAELFGIPKEIVTP